MLNIGDQDLNSVVEYDRLLDRAYSARMIFGLAAGLLGGVGVLASVKYLAQALGVLVIGLCLSGVVLVIQTMRNPISKRISTNAAGQVRLRPASPYSQYEVFLFLIMGVTGAASGVLILLGARDGLAPRASGGYPGLYLLVGGVVIIALAIRNFERARRRKALMFTVVSSAPAVIDVGAGQAVEGQIILNGKALRSISFNVDHFEFVTESPDPGPVTMRPEDYLVSATAVVLCLNIDGGADLRSVRKEQE